MNVMELVMGEDQAKIRGVKGESGEEWWSVYDFINAVCEKDSKDKYGAHVFYNLTQDTSEYKDEVCSSSSHLKFPGRGQRDTPCMTLRGLLRLLMILGGKVASGYRAVVETTFTRVMAGDRSLIHVIEANAQSSSPVQGAFRRALASDPSPGGGPADDYLDHAVGAKRHRWETLEYNTKQLALITASTDAYAKLCPGNQIDERMSLMFRDSIASLFMSGSGADNRPLTISAVASEMGLVLKKAELYEVGMSVSKAYQERHGKMPTKHDQMVEGSVRKVNSYTEADRDLVEGVISKVVKSRAGK
jgi:hypothetical protein